MSYKFLKDLRSSNSSLAKEKFLKEHLSTEDADLIKKILFYTYNSKYQFFVKKYKKENSDEVKYNINDMFNLLDKLRTREITGNAAIQAVQDMRKYLNDDDAEIFELILKKDLKAGINVKSINKVSNGLIPVFSYMGAIAFNKKKVHKLFTEATEVWAEIKYDGMFLNLIKVDNQIKTLSRSGKDLFLEDVFKDEIENVENVVITGELLVHGFNRYIANGMMNSYSTIMGKIKKNDGNIDKKIQKDIEKFNKRYGTEFDKIKEKIYVVAWDMIPYNDWKNGFSELTLKERRKILEEKFKNSNLIKLSEYKIIKNYKEAIDEFRKQKDNGEEGIILKDCNKGFEDGKPNFNVKFKVEIDVDLIVTGYEYGNEGTKNENVVNRIICESADGIVKTKTSGLTEKDMDLVTEMVENNDLVGKIVTVRSSGLSEDKNGNFSLLHPRFIEVREDKTEADDLEKIKEIEKAAFELS